MQAPALQLFHLRRLSKNSFQSVEFPMTAKLRLSQKTPVMFAKESTACPALADGHFKRILKDAIVERQEATEVRVPGVFLLRDIRTT